jgi:hypothetical protein
MQKQIDTATIEGKKKKGIPRERRRVEVEEGLITMGIKNKQAMTRDSRN